MVINYADFVVYTIILLISSLINTGKSSGTGTDVGTVAGGGVGIGFGDGIGATFGTDMVHTAKPLFRKSPRDSKPLTVTAEDVFCKLKDFRKDGKDVYASVEIITTVEASKLEHYPAKICPA